MATVEEPNFKPAFEDETSEPPPLQGKYYFVSSESVDEYLSGLGVGLVLRKVHQVSTPQLEINYSEDTNVWTIKMESIFHMHVLEAKFGEEVEDETFDVRSCTTILEGNLEGTRLTTRQKCEEGPDVETVFEKTNSETVTLTMTAKPRYIQYKAIQVFNSKSPPLEDPGEDTE